MENKVEFLQKTKNRATIWSNDPIPEHIPRDDGNSKIYMHPRFVAALFTTARTWKQIWCPSTDEWIKKLWDIYTMEYYSVDWNCAICSDVDGPRECQQSEATGAGIVNARDPCAGSGGYVDGPGWKETPWCWSHSPADHTHLDRSETQEAQNLQLWIPEW